MALLEQMNKVINQLESQEFSSDECASDCSEQIQYLVELLCAPFERQDDSVSKAEPNSTQEIHHLVNLLLEQLESYSGSSTGQLDSLSGSSTGQYDAKDEMDRLMDLLFDLIESPQSSDRTPPDTANPELTNHASSKSSDERLPTSQCRDDSRTRDTAENLVENSAEEMGIIAEFLNLESPPISDEAANPATPPTGVDGLSEKLLRSMNQQQTESVDELTEEIAEEEKAANPATPPTTVDGLSEKLLRSMNQQQTESVDELTEEIAEEEKAANPATAVDGLSEKLLQSMNQPEVDELTPEIAEEEKANPATAVDGLSEKLLRSMNQQQTESVDELTQEIAEEEKAATPATGVDGLSEKLLRSMNQQQSESVDELTPEIAEEEEAANPATAVDGLSEKLLRSMNQPESESVDELTQEIAEEEKAANPATAVDGLSEKLLRSMNQQQTESVDELTQEIAEEEEAANPATAVDGLSEKLLQSMNQQQTESVDELTEEIAEEEKANPATAVDGLSEKLLRSMNQQQTESVDELTEEIAEEEKAANPATAVDGLSEKLLQSMNQPEVDELTPEIAEEEKANPATSPTAVDGLSEKLLRSMNQPETESLDELTPEIAEEEKANPATAVDGLSEKLLRSMNQPEVDELTPEIAEEEKAANPATPPTAVDGLSEKLLQSMNQPEVDELTPEIAEELNSEPDPEEVASLVKCLRTLIFSNQPPQNSEGQAANSQETAAQPDKQVNKSLQFEEQVSSILEDSPETQGLDSEEFTIHLEEQVSSILEDSPETQGLDSEEFTIHQQQPLQNSQGQTPNSQETAAQPDKQVQPSDRVSDTQRSDSEEFTIHQHRLAAEAATAIDTDRQSAFIEVEVLEPLEDRQQTDESEFETLQNILVNSEVDPLRKLNEQLDLKLTDIEEQIYDPQKLINLLMPVIAELLNLKVEQSKDDISRAIAPIIDRAIQHRSEQDKTAMCAVIASLIPEAISQQIKNSPEDIAKAIAPEMAPAIREQIKLDRGAIANVLAPQMGEAIKKQIKLEKDSMVDALYPVIGSTVSKYIAEAIRDINDKITKTLSGNNIRRKMQAKIHGVSEGELIFKESMYSIVQGVFLIQKESGLIISEAQPSDTEPLESEMVAGMLTAIRSFVNDCILQSGEMAELDDIEYGLSTIKLEVAGYCYLAVVIKGASPPKKFVQQLRKTLGEIVVNYSETIENFDGDPETVPPKIHEMLAKLIAISEPEKQQTSRPLLQLLLLAAAGLLFLPWGWISYQNFLGHRQETQVLSALDSTPELAIYAFNVQVDDDTVTVRGKLPNLLLRSKAENIIKSTAPTLKLNNQIVAIDMPPDPVLVEQEVSRITETLNQMAGISITAKYIEGEGKVMVDGIVIQEIDSQNIAQAFSKIPGVNSLVSAVQVQPLSIETRIYFEHNSSNIKPEDVNKKLLEIKRFLTQYPQLHLNIVGHSDRTGQQASKQRLALNRAETIKKALILLGVAPERLNISASPDPPIDVDNNQPNWKHRCVIFYPVIPDRNQP